VKMAEAIVALSPRKATTGTFRRPDAKSAVGLTDALARRISHQDEA
jgi:allantoin racemase